jgi:hypothetical protein
MREVEFQALLLQCLHADPALPEPSTLARLSPDDWVEFLDLAIRHRVTGSVSPRLRTQQRCELVPEACLKRANGVLRGTLLSNLRQQVGLVRVLKACAAAQFQVMLLKGLWLAETVYRDLKARSSLDIDILVHPRDLPRFTAVARDLGFNVPPGVSDLRDIASAANEFHLFHGSQGTSLDLHWNLTQSKLQGPLDEETLWQRAEKVTVAGQSCLTLRLEDHLIYLCFHAADHHHFTEVGPRALLDVARLMDDPPRPLDWNDVVARAHALGWSRGVWLLLDLAREHLGARPLQSALDALRPVDADDPVIRSATMVTLFHGQRRDTSLGGNLVRLTGQSTARERAALLWSRLFPPREQLATYFKTHVDDPALPLLYIRRLGHLIKRHGPKVARLLRRDRAAVANLERERVIERWLEQERHSTSSGNPFPAYFFAVA